MQVVDALDEYRYAILQLADQTQEWYLRRLSPFARWCADQHIELGQLRSAHIARFLYEEATRISPRTGALLSSYSVHSSARAIRTFLNWCAAEPQKYCSHVVPANMAMPKLKQSVIEIFRNEEIDRLFVACDDYVFSRTLSVRNKAIIALLLDTGIRAGELVGLTLQHVHLASREGYIRVCGKGDKEREIGLGAKARQLLHSYIKKYRPTPKGEDHVFLTYKRQPMTVCGLDLAIHDLSVRAHVVDCHPHKFRHTFAVNFLLQGGDIYVLSRLMGHSSVQITEIYLRAIKDVQARKTSKSVLDNL